jgi:DNA-binding NarL/FixJ family response regulator
MTAAAFTRPLKPRESEILELLADGEDTREIAARLHLSCPTIKTYIHDLIVATGARNRTHAVAIGFRTGLLR